jgi:tetratricopeptide (TPR) repeat protein
MSKKADKFLQAAQEAMGKRNYAKAIKNFRSYLSVVPDDKKALYTLADAYVFEGDIPTAIQLYMQVANHLKGRGFTMKAIAVCKRIINIDENNSRARNLMMELYQDKTTEEESSKIITSGALTEKKDEGERKEEEAEAQKTLDFIAQSAEVGGPVTYDEVSVSGMQAVSQDPDIEKSTGSQLFKETVAMPKAASPDQFKPPSAATTESMPETLTGGFEIVDSQGQEIKTSTLFPTPEQVLDEKPASKPGSQRTMTQETRILGAKDLLFNELNKDEYLRLIDKMEIRIYQPGDMIVKEGDPGDSMFIICSGEVRVMTRDKSGKEVELAVLGEGDFFGEVSLLTGKPRTATILSKANTELLELNSRSLPEIESYCPNLRSKLEDFYHRRTMHTIETLISFHNEE